MGGGGMGGEAVNDWSCIGAVPAPEFMPGSAVGNIRVGELLDDRPMPDIAVRVCRSVDTTCAPLDEGVTDARGAVTLDVTTAEQRYLELEGPGMLPALSFYNGPPRSDPFDELVRVVAPRTFAALEALLEITADPQRGHAGVQANDCRGEIGVGVTFELSTADASTLIGYFDPSGAPNPALVETSSDGRAAIANIPTGPAVLTAKIGATTIGTRTFFARAGAISYPACVEAAPEP